MAQNQPSDFPGDYYVVVEPAIHTELDWDMDVIVRVLTHLCFLLPKLQPELKPEQSYFLLRGYDMFRSPYPVLGLIVPDDDDDHWIRAQSRLTALFEKQLNTAQPLTDAATIKPISWEELNERGYCFPQKG